jgi:hypothetical protein
LGGLPAPSLPLVERQEPALLPGERGAHPHLAVVHREMDGAAARAEYQLLGVAVGLVLRLGMGSGLPGQRVLQLERRERQPVDERARSSARRAASSE